MKRSVVIWIITTVFIISGARVWSLYGDAQRKWVNITLNSSVAGTAQIFYDLGQGISEKDSSRIDIDNDPGYKEYRFPIPNEEIHHLRFDPLQSGGHVKIERIRIVDGLGNIFLSFDLKQLEPVHQIRKIVVSVNQVSIDIDDRADDPRINILLPAPLSFKRLHKSFLLRMLLDFLMVMFLIFIMYLWVNWRDPKNMKKWICYAVIMLGFAIVMNYFFQIFRDILNQSVRPIHLGDTNVYLYMAAKKWTSPDFYQGLRPFGVPLLYSLVNGAKKTQNIILLQTALSYVSWTYLAFVAACVLKDYLTKAAVFFLIASIPLNNSIHFWNMVILSESISFSFLAFFLGAYLWYYNKHSIPSIIFLVFVASLLVLMRDMDAYLILFMIFPVFWILVQHIREKMKTAVRHIVLLSLFIFLFIGSVLSANDMHYEGGITPFTNTRQSFSLFNIMGQKILPYEDRIKYFEAHGLLVTPELMLRVGKWASSDDWRWYNDPDLAPQREWIYRHGKSTYAKYLITHPGYVFLDAFYSRMPLLFLMAEQDAWFQRTVKPVPSKLFSIFFVNNEKQLRFFLFIFLAVMILACVEYVCKKKGQPGGYLKNIHLILYMIVITLPYGLLCYHGDPMEVDRHALSNIIRLNVGSVLLYIFMIDLLINKMCILKHPVNNE